MKKQNPVVRLRKICVSKELLSYAEDYVNSCRATENDGKRTAGDDRFPNLAGFARMLGVSMSTLKKVETRYPEQYGAILALFEDEALNSCKSPTVLSAYLKERLDFGEKKEGGAPVKAGDVRLIFEHDIMEDGR